MGIYWIFCVPIKLGKWLTKLPILHTKHKWTFIAGTYQSPDENHFKCAVHWFELRFFLANYKPNKSNKAKIRINKQMYIRTFR